MPTEAKPGRYGRQPLKDALLEAGVTHAAAAEAVGFSVNQVTMAANGQTQPSLTFAGRMADFLGVSIEELFSPSMLGLEEPKKARKGKART